MQHCTCSAAHIALQHCACRDRQMPHQKDCALAILFPMLYFSLDASDPPPPSLSACHPMDCAWSTQPALPDALRVDFGPPAELLAQGGPFRDLCAARGPAALRAFERLAQQGR